MGFNPILSIFAISAPRSGCHYSLNQFEDRGDMRPRTEATFLICNIEAYLRFSAQPTHATRARTYAHFLFNSLNSITDYQEQYQRLFALCIPAFPLRG